MERIYTTIGEHFIQIQCHSETITNWIQRNFPAVALTKVKPHLSIQLTEGYGIPFVDYNVAITKEANTISFRRADYLIETDLEYRNAKISVHNELALKHALMNLYSSYLVYHQWGLLIHSSCAIDKGKAYLFAGHSGAGKSTAAKLSQPRELFSDEATIVKITSDQITVFNSPFRSELDRTGVEESSPLAGIYLLNQAIDNHIVPLNKSNGFLNLMDKVFYWSHSSDETGNILQLLQHVVNAVPVYELHFQKNNTFWELIL
ncbi:hypothetical protein [Paenibacillus sp. Soil724D2]|uniref:hypothetical protein n=1 Tax=Paenibacillus sp. (strain Soil724D2) TaxID=1736392 RepID=UPI0007135FB5|nr:hypothetical protein [Paenibacillus sp. Soil724D2]KRE51017.1 hypothetical protein ASG85_18820 [Paenibacillus sp. Soil724D2]